YARGFLRSYSEFLHLDADRIVAMYDASLAPPAEPVPESTEVPPARPAMRRSKPLVAAAVAAVIVAGYLAGSRDEQPRHQGAPLQSQAPPQGVVAPPASSAPAVPPAAPVPPQAPEVPAPPAVAAGRTVLTLSFTRDAHMVMNVDGEMPQEYEVRAGDVIEWEGERFFAVELSDGAAVEARLGGKPVKALGNGPVSVVLRTDGTTE
ncbi:MAG TPA: RodZ domain-containing protein, partial [Verrucomicrobiae bacterium]|nr:RodZ domain-containing protein [Verrucomicrobiae bacterium]